MGEKIVVGPISHGLRNDVTPFNIDNDSFPTLINAYQWRDRVKRKRGTALLGRLKRYFDSVSEAYNSGSIDTTLINDGSGNGEGNLLTDFSLQEDGNIVPGTVFIDDISSGDTYTDPGEDGILVGSPSGSGTINYATGDFVISGAAGDTAVVAFFYYPGLPVLGLEDFVRTTSAFAGTIGFDTTYSYEISVLSPYDIFDVSFYKNPSGPNTPKGTWTPVTWNGRTYQQFYTVNYQGAMWATNGIPVPFDATNIGMQFKFVTNVMITTNGNGSTIPAVADITIATHGLEIGDYLFFNEINGITGINWQTGYVTAVPDLNTVTVTFPIAILGGAFTTPNGIAQYLTNRSDTTVDCIRWYDGDPVDGSNPPVFSTGKGWVNFMPPLSQSAFSIGNLPPLIYYLVGAKVIFPFKDRLLFFGPVVQAKTGNPIYLQDTVVYSFNGTPYYTASWNNTADDPTLADTVFSPLLVPTNQIANPTAYFEDSPGFGGNITAGIDQPINTVSPNEDALIVGFDTVNTRLVYSGNDIIPFNFFLINSELGSVSTFSTINLDKGVITKGSRGYVITSQVQSQRIDLEIPDQVFQVNLNVNGNERMTAYRDFINEWIYFTYPANNKDQRNVHTYNTQSLQYNYRDISWALFNESYTHYGTFRQQTGNTWATIGDRYGNWLSWNDPWSAGQTTLLQPQVIGGNQQGFVLFRAVGTSEGASLTIQSISGNTITSPDHCLNNGDYIYITDALGMTNFNNRIYSVYSADKDTFKTNPTDYSGTYSGLGLITRLYVPFVQTKQFPAAWGLSRKTRIGPQQYLLTTTDKAQITLLIFLSQNASSPYNEPPILPEPGSNNNGLIYSTVLYTCPESTNLGLTPANINLQMVTGIQQQQIWHRMNTSLLGDTVQLGFTLSDAQMRAVTDDGGFISQEAEIELHGFILDVSPSQVLA